MSMQPATPAETAPSLDRVREVLKRRYRVVRELGSGRMGTVYFAYQKRGNRPVAIRVLAPHLAADPEKRERFVRAAKAARLVHPNVVSIRAVRQTEGIVYVVMDYVEGETLGRRVRREGPMTVGAATRMLYDVARGLACAHLNDVVHGDLAPDNVMIERGTGRGMVMDPGLARALAGCEVDRAAHRAARAPFVSPEQVKGAAGDQRSDIYAVGVIGYFAVTGYLPFDGDTAEEIFVKHVMEPAPGFRLYNQNLDATFGDVLRKCLLKDPARRFGDGFYLARTLEMAPEIRRHLPLDLGSFVLGLSSHLQSASSSAILAGGALCLVVLGAWASYSRVVATGVGILILMAADWAFTVLGETRYLLAKDYSRADMIRALRIEAERWRERAAFHNGGVAPGPWRWPRRMIYAALAVVGLGAAVTLMELWPREVGKLAMLLGAGTASMVVIVSVEEARTSWYRATQFWLTVWQGRVGAWIVRVAGWRVERCPTPAAEAPEILMLRRPSFEYWRRIEAVRDLVNLVPAMEHRVASRIDGIRRCLNPEAFGTSDGLAAPPLDHQMRQRLEHCRDRLQLVWRRLRAVQVKDSRKRLEAEFKMVEEACEVADELLGTARLHRNDAPRGGANGGAIGQ